MPSYESERCRYSRMDSCVSRNRPRQAFLTGARKSRISGNACQTFAFIALSWVSIGDSVTSKHAPTRCTIPPRSVAVGDETGSSNRMPHNNLLAFVAGGGGQNICNWKEPAFLKPAICWSAHNLLRPRRPFSSRTATKLVMMANNVDYFEVLGVQRDAPFDVIKKSYYRLAMLHHPDHSTDPGARVRFSRLSLRYCCTQFCLVSLMPFRF
jgi:hypothetical protein